MRGPISVTMRSPLAVRGMSVVPVWERCEQGAGEGEENLRDGLQESQLNTLAHDLARSAHRSATTPSRLRNVVRSAQGTSIKTATVAAHRGG